MISSSRRGSRPARLSFLTGPFEDGRVPEEGPIRQVRQGARLGCWVSWPRVHEIQLAEQGSDEAVEARIRQNQEPALCGLFLLEAAETLVFFQTPQSGKCSKYGKYGQSGGALTP